MSSTCWTANIKISQIILFKYGSKAQLKKLLSVSLGGGRWRFCNCLRGLGSLKLALRCLRTSHGTGSEQQQLDRELTRRFWRSIICVCLGRLHCFVSSTHHQGLLYRHLYCWTLEMMVQTNALQFKGNSLPSLNYHLFVRFRFWKTK